MDARYPANSNCGLLTMTALLPPLPHEKQRDTLAHTATERLAPLDFEIILVVVVTTLPPTWKTRQPCQKAAPLAGRL